MGELIDMINSSFNFDVVVIGSGPAGQNAALEATDRGARVLVIEQEPRVGGACVQYGTIPSKTLRETALTLSAFQRRSGDVYRISHESALSVTSLMKRLQEVVSAHQQSTAMCLDRAGVERICGRARFLSPHEVEITKVSGQVIVVSGTTIVIASGSRPRSPENIAVDHENILDSDSVLSMSYLPTSLLILGGGVIACEYASTFASLGVKVTMLDRATHPLCFVEKELSDYFLRQLEANGGCFVGGCELSEIVWDGLGSVRASLRNGEEFHADKAFVALGRVANADTLKIDRAGLRQTDRGLLSVNDFCQTAVPHIYAVGDTIGPPALASASMEQGRRAVCHALAGSRASRSALLPTGIYTIPEIATVGLTEQQAVETVGRPIVARVPFAQIARAQIMASPSGMLKLVADNEGRKLLGVQVAGDNATELVHLGQMAMLADLPVDIFVHSTFNFPTMAEAYRLAALDLVHARESQSGKSDSGDSSSSDKSRQYAGITGTTA